jgi:hypothetical protein
MYFRVMDQPSYAVRTRLCSKVSRESESEQA